MAACLIALWIVAGSNVSAQDYGQGQGYGQSQDDGYATSGPDPNEPVDEAMRLGRSVSDFPTEYRDVFQPMDQIIKDGQLVPVPLDPDDEADRNVIRGRNTWILWCGGNEGFWNWIAQDGYAILDFLKLLDSRQRNRRFKDLGLCNQPGMVSSNEEGPWGLYIDRVDKLLPNTGYGERYNNYPTLRDSQGRELKSDGVDPRVYGYPSGVIGFRLFPNPAFNEDPEAQRRWNAKTFYNDPNYSLDPSIVRPLRVGMSCALCHVAAHPLNPPADPEEPEWENLSSIIGNQYFRTSAVLSSQVPRGNFLRHFLISQQPGTVDTSMTCSDHINNSNAMNAIFDVPARLLDLAASNPAEEQGVAAQTLPMPLNEGVNPRRTPRVLIEGADSVGTFGALARVYLNIGLFWEEWNEVNNTIIGVKPQRPFKIETCRTNSVYWQVNEQYRVGYLADYFLHGHEDRELMLTQPMFLKDALVEKDGELVPLGKSDSELAKQHLNDEAAASGRLVFARHCMVCHSSKQPNGFDIAFAHKAPGGDGWDKSPVDSEKLVMPYAWDDWEAFKASPAYLDYEERALDYIAEEEDFFHKDNFLSTERRIPVTLVQTNSARAIATNAIAGEVWAEYSSETYKQLPAVGDVSYYNVFTGNEETYRAPGGGRGYFRPPSLISIWATAPLLHNNALGHYIPDDKAAHRVSVEGRLEMFDDAIGKLLWRDRRGRTPSGEEGLRDPGPSTWRGNDPGWVFRTADATHLYLPRLQVRAAVESLVPGFLLYFVDVPWIVPALLALATLLAAKYSRLLLFILTLVSGVLLLLVLLLTGIVYLLPDWWFWLGVLLLVASLFSLIFTLKRFQREGEREDPVTRYRRWLPWLKRLAPSVAPAVMLLFCVALFGGLSQGRAILDGETEFRLGPIPKGTPVSAIMNIDPAASPFDLLGVGRGLLKAIDIIKRDGLTDEQALEVFNKHAGPALLKVSKCPDYVLDRGHYFGESLSDEEKEQLIAFLKTL